MEEGRKNMDKTCIVRLPGRVDSLGIPYEFALATLRTAFEAVGCERKCYPAGSKVKEMIVMTNRLILIEAGCLVYQAEGERRSFSKGAMIFVPNWVRRTWTTLRGCTISWCDFATEHLEESPGTIFWRSLSRNEFGVEQESFDRLHTLVEHAGAQGAQQRLLACEGEIKAMLGRFWAQAAAMHAGAGRSSGPAVRPDLIRVREGLVQHYANPDALERLEVPMSAAHFRRLYRRTFGESPQQTILRLRMRRARFLLHETEMLIKQVAAAVGYADPLYFSRQYRRFWGRSPRNSRTKGAL
jgi:AraC-like DNA-binding protein